MNAREVVLAGLRALEYRGYDSSGMYVVGGDICKVVGGVDGLAEALRNSLERSLSAIGHTRWATHGGPSTENAHPHHNADKTIVLVHNGIIENYKELKQELEASGEVFYSQTDSEVLVKLISFYYRNDIEEAVQKTVERLKGKYAFVVAHAEREGRIMAVSNGAPLVLGIGNNGTYVASDTSALAGAVNAVVYLQGQEIVSIEAEKYTISTFAKKRVHRTLEKISIDKKSVQKNGFTHYMLKEINDGPKVVTDTLRGRVVEGSSLVRLEEFGGNSSALLALNQMTIIGCGSAYYAGLFGKQLLERYANLPTSVELASEYTYASHPKLKKNGCLAITQSGETADTLAGLEKSIELGHQTYGIVNTVGSSIARKAGDVLYNHAGPEIAVASTKAFISQLTALTLFSCFLGQGRGIDNKKTKALVKALQTLPETLAVVLSQSEDIKKIASRYTATTSMFFVGRGDHVSIAYEGALKMKEVSYIHAEAYPAGELKHGPIALLSTDTPVVALMPSGKLFPKMLSAVEEMRARGAPVLIVTTEDMQESLSQAQKVLFLPKTHPALQPIVSAMFVHLLAYYVACGKGHDVDRPRNLAKSVTVE